MHLIVGLGNPGAEYAAHRHNIGFLAVDEIARQHSFPPFRQKFSALVSEGLINGDKVMLIKPQSHIRQARPATPQSKVPETGPMADMLKKLFGTKD